MTRRAVILAAGLGTRMRRPAPGARLHPEQERVAATGIKTLIPIAGRSLFERLVDAVRSAGIEAICVVVGRQHDELVDRCRKAQLAGQNISTALQHEPRGTADALLAAERFAAGEPFLMLNSDNLYSADDLLRLAELAGPGLLAVDRRQALVDGLSQEKLRSWAIVEADSRGRLVGLVEKPDPSIWRKLTEPVLLSCNAWRFESPIFASCRRSAPSPRGEIELPTAVLDALRRRPGRGFRVLVAEDRVFDLSERRDVALLEAAWSESR